MRFFDKRPLALILCSMICGFVAFTIGEVLLRITAICIIPLLLMFSVIIKRKRALFISVSVALMLSFLLSFLYFDIWYFPADRYDSDVTVSGTVCSVNEDDMTLLVLTDSIEGESVGSYKLLVEVEEYQLYAFSAGSKVEFRAELLSYGDKMSSDEKAALISDKINSYAALTSDIRLVSSGEKPLELLLSESREALGRRLMSLSDNESGRLLSALLLGEREMLDDSTALGFRRLGITHILALSGMHLAILSLGLSKLLSLFGIGKRTASVFNIVFTILYMV